MTATVFAWDTDQMPRRPPKPGEGPDEWAAWRIGYERERRRWSQGELARQVTAAGVPMQQQAIWRIENDRPPRRISLAEAIAFCEVFGIAEVGDLANPPSQVSGDEYAQARKAIDQQKEIVDRWREYVQQQERILEEQEASGDHFGAGLRVLMSLATLGSQIDQVLSGSEIEPGSEQPHPEADDLGRYKA